MSMEKSPLWKTDNKALVCIRPLNNNCPLRLVLSKFLLTSEVDFLDPSPGKTWQPRIFA